MRSFLKPLSRQCVLPVPFSNVTTRVNWLIISAMHSNHHSMGKSNEYSFPWPKYMTKPHDEVMQQSCCLTYQSRWLNQNMASPAGNWTPVSRVTGGDTHHYTTEDPIVWSSYKLCSLVFKIFLHFQQQTKTQPITEYPGTHLHTHWATTIDSLAL